MSNCKFKIIQKYLRRVGEKLVSYWMPASFLYTIRLLGGNPTQKLEEVARPKSGLKTEIPQKSWKESLGRNRV